MTTTETAEVFLVVLVVTALAVMTTAAEAPHLVTTTTAEIPTLVLLHPAPAVPQSMTTPRPEAVLTLLMTVMVHLLQPAATRLIPTPTATAESLENLESLGSPESLTAALPALLQDASVATMQATTVDLTGDYPFLTFLTKTNFS